METRGSGQSGNAAASQNPFKQLASMLGIDGKQVSMPALMGVPATSVDLIYVALVAAAALIFKSWKIPIGALLGSISFSTRVIIRHRAIRAEGRLEATII